MRTGCVTSSPYLPFIGPLESHIGGGTLTVLLVAENLQAL